MNAYLFFDPRARPLSIAGAILPGAVLKFFISETLAPTPVYADAGLATPLGTEVTADDNGQFVPIYLSPLITYRVQIYDADGVLQPDGDVDPLCPSRDYPPRTVMFCLGTAEERDESYPPALWQVLDGSNGTPDGRDRCVIIAGADYVAGDTDGELVTQTEEGGGVEAGVTGSTVLTAEMGPLHTHRAKVRTSATLKGNTHGFGFANTAGFEGQIIDDGPFDYLEDDPYSSEPLIEPTGSADPDGHDHPTPEIEPHTHGIPGDGLPPVIALWALMRRVS